MKNSTLIYCLDVLKIKEDSEVYRNAHNVPIESENKWMSAIMIIANASVGYTFSQSQLADFLTLAAKGIEHTNTSSDTIVFKIYRDIENYENFSESLKSNYPRIIVDVISNVINHDSRVNPIVIEKHYQLKKQEAGAANKEKAHLGETLTTAPTSTTAAAIHKEKLPLSTDELIVRLVHITNRDIITLQKSTERLPYSDLKKISELCRNYSKLQRYSKLITKEQLKNEIQKEIGRELRPYQLTRAANSIRRVQLYIENILDNKFVHDASHGINHIKHNLEYGYSLMNLIELPRRRRP
ncbi:MAG TPA: hypothetical protein VFD60_00010 [Nitrososphaeraceae archaeon]|nr:hypothetical protein [Nitrososphaeraceae archaeon]